MQAPICKHSSLTGTKGSPNFVDRLIKYQSYNYKELYSSLNLNEQVFQLLLELFNKTQASQHPGFNFIQYRAKKPVQSTWTSDVKGPQD